MTTDAATEVRFSTSQGMALIELHRPTRGNALSIELMQALRAALEQAQRDSDVKVIQLRAAGKHFCTGADLSWANTESALWAEGHAALNALLEALYVISKPVVARVHGTVIGAGVALLCLCDQVVAVDEATWRLPEVKLGMVPSAIVPALRQVASTAAIRQLIFTDRAWSSQAMQAFGVVAELVSVNGLDGAVEACIEAWRSLAPSSVMATKRLLRELGRQDFEHASERGRVHAATV